MSTDTDVEFVLKTNPGKPENLVSSVVEYDCSNLEKKFKLYTSKNTNNMNLFNTKFQLRKYDTIYDIIEDDYFPTRLELYSKRKAHQLKWSSHCVGDMPTCDRNARDRALALP